MGDESVAVMAREREERDQTRHAQLIALAKDGQDWRERALDAERSLTAMLGNTDGRNNADESQLKRVRPLMVKLLIAVANATDPGKDRARVLDIYREIAGQGLVTVGLGGAQKEAADVLRDGCEELRAYGLIQPETPPDIVVLTKRGRALIAARCKTVYSLLEDA